MRSDDIRQFVRNIANDENHAISELVYLRDDVSDYNKTKGKGIDDLVVVDHFDAFRLAKSLISKSRKHDTTCVFVGAAKDEQVYPDVVEDVRFFIETKNRSLPVLEIVNDLLQFWEIYLRYHTDLDLEEFSNEVRAALLGRIKEAAIHASIARRLAPISKLAPTGSSINVLEEEIRRRLEQAAFYLEEREILRPELTNYTEKTFSDDTNEGAKRNRMRIRSTETSLIHELVHLNDSVTKFFEKQKRESELVVIDSFRPYRIAANLVNVLKHGVRGRNKDCAVIEFESVIFSEGKEDDSSGTSVQDVVGFVNYNGELFSLIQLIEDVAQIWELFLRHHSNLPLTEFQNRFGDILLSRKGLTTYSAPMPKGLEEWSKKESKWRKQLDLK